MSIAAASIACALGSGLFNAIRMHYNKEFARPVGGALIVVAVLSTWRLSQAWGWWTLPAFYALGFVGTLLIAKIPFDVLLLKGGLWALYILAFLLLLPAWFWR